jgi:long-chain acyl-CoA synthetase
MVIPREGSSITAEALKTFCLEKGPAYAHPRFIHLVSSFPLNGAGKIDRAVARSQLEQAYLSGLNQSGGLAAE